MKFALNGALTIGTLDGANVEIREEVGPENFFLFGHTTEEVALLKAQGYRPCDHYEKCPQLKQALDQIAAGYFSREDPELFWPLVDSLMTHDPYMLLADYDVYIACQEQVGRVYLDPQRWVRMSILNVARMGKFSSDRSILEYCEDIWLNLQVLKRYPTTSG